MSWLSKFRQLLHDTLDRSDSPAAHPPRRVNDRQKLTREDVENMIRAHGGSVGLKLSGYDLSRANLIDMDLRGVVFGTTSIQGIERATSAAILRGAHLSNANLTGANLSRVDLTGAGCWQTVFYEATLSNSTLRGANLGKADLRRTDLYGADLREAGLEGAKLQGANLCGVHLSGAELAAESLGAAVIQESVEQYAEYFERAYIDPEVQRRYSQRHLQVRFIEARDIYRALKNAFMECGRYHDASWAYVRERQMEKATHSPSQARACYSYELHDLPPNSLGRLIRLLRFHVRHLWHYVVDTVTYTACGYGESPLLTLVWGLVTVIVFAGFYKASSGIESVSGTPLTWLDYLNYSLGAFATVDFASFAPHTPLAQTLTSIQGIFGISILALLMFALGNRISRS